MNSLFDLSRAQAEVVARASAWTVRVDGRRQYAVSGTAFDDRHVLTLDHTTERDEELVVTLPGGRTAKARVRGRDPRSDLALLALEVALTDWARIASEPARLGSIVYVLGRPDDEAEAVQGMVSAIGGPIRLRGGQRLDGFVATDALRVPGFSGGPVVDASGSLVGITMNSLREARSFAVGAAQAWRVGAVLRDHGSIHRGYLGIRSQPAALDEGVRRALRRDQDSGLLVVGVEPGGPAAAAGLLTGDIVVGFAGAPVREHDDLLDALGPESVDRSSTVLVARGGELREIGVTPRAAP